MNNWRLARSLELFRHQMNIAFPNRSKKSDGTIGDARHAKVKSDHNPNIKDKNGIGVVCAFDLTNDPAHGVTCETIFQTLKKNADPRIKYLIWNSRIWYNVGRGREAKYTGSNPHRTHLHISVKPGTAFSDGNAMWKL